MGGAKVDSSHRGHFLQFRLRTLMLIMTVCALFFGWLSSHLKHQEQLLHGREIVDDAMVQFHWSPRKSDILERTRRIPHPLDNGVAMIEIDPASDWDGTWDPYECRLLTRRNLDSFNASSLGSRVTQSALRRLPGTADSIYYEVVRLRKTCCECHREFSEGQVIAVFKTRVGRGGQSVSVESNSQ